MKKLILDYNFKELASGLYLVRTVAGFKRARKDFDEFSTFEGYPESYPSVVRLGHCYKGYEYIRVHCSHVNRYKEHLLELYNEIKDD